MKIVPHQHTDGIDICSVTKKQFAIIRSDLGCWMSTTDLHEGSELQVYKLHENCTGGDSYCADYSGKYYIIKGTYYHSCKDLSTDKDGEDYSLLDGNQGGIHYFNWGGEFTLVTGKSGQKIIWTTNMNKFEAGNANYLSPLLSAGSYYWANKNYVCAMFQPNEDVGGLYFNEGNNPVMNNYKGEYVTVPMDVVNFLPGGIAQSQGKAFGKWRLLYSTTATDPVPQIIQTYIGFDSSAVSSITDNWTFNGNMTLSEFTLLKLMCQYQFSLDATYGGISTDTTSLDWDKLYIGNVHTNPYPVDIPANGTAYVWQYRLGFGEKTCLYGNQLQVTLDSNPPDTPPDEISTVQIGAKL